MFEGVNNAFEIYLRIMFEKLFSNSRIILKIYFGSDV